MIVILITALLLPISLICNNYVFPFLNHTTYQITIDNIFQFIFVQTFLSPFITNQEKYEL